MATQIEQYRVAFDKMSLSQKKAFIEKLRAQLQGRSNATYKAFLNECVQKYNAAARSGVPSRNNFDNLLDDFSAIGISVAEPAQRFIAFLLDCLLTLPIIFLDLVIQHDLERVPRYHYGMTYNGNPIYNSSFNAIYITAIILVVYSIILFIFQLRYWTKGTSFGKSRLNLIVVNKDTGKPISTGYMFLREVFGKMISGIVFSLGFIWILVDRDKQGWHDKLVSSVVVKK